MDIRSLTNNQKNTYNKVVTHIMQSWEWGEFRKNLGLPLLRFGLFQEDHLIKAFQLTLHQIPFTDKMVGYLPKGPLPDEGLYKALCKIGQDNNCAFIKLEPNILTTSPNIFIHPKFKISPKPLFTKYNFILDLTPSEEKLLKNMHPKTRYNIRLAQKKGVRVEVRADDQALESYLQLYFETTKRQSYHGHNEKYHKKVWETFKKSGMARIIIGLYQGKPLSAWMLLNFKDTLYYPYGGSSIEHKDVMANNLVAWEAIKLGRKLKLKKLDMWGALSPDADPYDPWYGFHRFKQGYGGDLVEYIGTYDLIFNYPLYWSFTKIDKFIKLKVSLLKLLGK